MSDESIAYDPYALPIDGIEDPPTTLWLALRRIGPGIVLAGTIVGSGELILTTGLGAKHGFTFLWLVLFSCVIKVFVQIELGRYAISSGKPTLGALYSIVPGSSIGKVLIWWWFLMMVFTVFQLGGMTGGVGQSLDLAFPQITDSIASIGSSVSTGLGDFVLKRREFPWAMITCLVTMALIFRGGYRRIEGLTTVIVVGVTTITVLSVCMLCFTDYPIRWSEVESGMMLHIPDHGVADAFAIFGITGVGATELFYYPYWCLEKGYARFVGPNDGSLAWEGRAQGWIRVMHLDAWVSMVVFTLSTVAFYAMGAAVLHPQGLVPEGPKLIETLSNMYVGPFGNWAKILFLVGAGAVLFKTLYLACAANSRLSVDFLNIVGLTQAPNAVARQKRISIFCLLFPMVALLLYLYARDPKLMVKAGGIAQAATLPMIGLATLYFRYKNVAKGIQPLWITDLLLWIAVVAIVIVALYVLPGQVRDLYNLMRPAPS